MGFSRSVDGGDVLTFSRRNSACAGDIKGDSVDRKSPVSDAGNDDSAGDNNEAAGGLDSGEKVSISDGDADRLDLSIGGGLGCEKENREATGGGECDLTNEVVVKSLPSTTVTEKLGSRKAVEAPLASRREKGAMKAFPPLLSILNTNGRPRFNLELVRQEGRLRIMAVPNCHPEVVRAPRGVDGHLKLEFIRGDGDEDDGGVDHTEDGDN